MQLANTRVMSSPTLRTLALAIRPGALALALAGCVVEMPSLANEDLSALGAARNYRTFEQASARPYPSAISAGTINVWVSPEAAEAYAAIRPGQSGSNVRLPVGAMIVREVLDENGGIQSLTMMAKGPLGYAPELGDWWFAVTGPDGDPNLVNDEWSVGRMANCQSCHLPRVADDYLFGVPDEVRP